MKRVFFSAVTAAASLTLASCVLPYQKQSEEVKKTITVHGTGVVTSHANIANITFSVVTQEWVAKVASESNAAISRQVYEAIKGAGVGADDITTSDINIYRQDTFANGRTFAGRYRVSNNIRVRIRNVEKVSAVVDAAVAAGATEMSGLTFDIGDTSLLLREARTKAVKDAQDTASLLAGASGCKIGDVITIREGDIPPSNTLRRGIGENTVADTAAGTPIKEGDVSITSNVSVTYMLQ